MNEWSFHPASDPSADAGQARFNTLSSADIHTQLEHILASSYFRGSLRLTNFLRFVVETTLAGESGCIKAYTIAIEALGRGPDFDPQRDPIVRVEAGRLRKTLARYYGEAGSDAPLLIELPRGTYVPVFRRSDAATPQAPATHDLAPPLGLKPLAASCREPHLMRKAVTRQSKEVAAQIAVTRAALADSRSLLQQPFPNIAGYPAPPLSPALSPVSDDEKTADREGADDFEPQPGAQSQPRPAASGIRQILPFGAAPKSRLRKYGRAIRIVLYVLGILGFLEAVFDIDHPLTGGKNHGLFFRALAAVHNPPSRQAGRGI